MPKSARDALHAKGKTDVYYLDPDKVVLVTDRSSALYDERVENSYSEELVRNILYAPDGETAQGVLEPTLGRRNPETGQVEIIDGRQRTLACREANKRQKKRGLPPVWLPVLLKRGSDSRAMAMLISANEHRTADSPLNRAKKAQRYIDLGHDEKGVAALLGTSEATVKNLLSLLDAPAAVRNAVESGKISTSDGYKLARLEPGEARTKVAELVEKAPRTPGKKRSPNAAKARAIVSKGKPEKIPVLALAGAPPAAAAADWDTRKVEDRTAKTIAAWIEANWSGGAWAGAPDQIPNKLRAGEWREHRTDRKEAEHAEAAKVAK
jgi:ParB family transcriptional regulator, chromosome partitioning protein